jgi:protease I
MKVFGFFLILVLCLQFTTVAEGGAGMKNAVMIIAQENFRDEELFRPKDVLEENGIEVKVASTSLRKASGMLGGAFKPDMLVNEINPGDFAAIIFVGGSGASQYWNDPLAHKLAQEASSQGKIVAAICIAPVTLANAGILKGRRATVWPSEGKALEQKGAQYSGKPVEVDGNIITASGPEAAVSFAHEIARQIGDGSP